jgi:hypothetical protein
LTSRSNSLNRAFASRIPIWRVVFMVTS